MHNRYDNILFDQDGQSLPLSADEVIVVLVQQLHQLQQDKVYLENQLSLIRKILLSCGKDIVISIEDRTLPF